MTVIFVTSSGTEIGKTYVSALLTRQLRAKGVPVRAIKPVVSGLDETTFPESDPAALMAAMGEEVVYENVGNVSHWRFEAALSPDMAARREGQTISFDELVEYCVAASGKDDPLLIEGVGGVAVPLDDGHTVLDWMSALEAHVFISPLLVVGSYLGTISHTLTALESLRARKLDPRAIVVSETPGSEVNFNETIETIARFAGGTPVVGLPRGGETDLAALYPL